MVVAYLVLYLLTSLLFPVQLVYRKYVLRVFCRKIIRTIISLSFSLVIVIEPGRFRSRP